MGWASSVRVFRVAGLVAASLAVFSGPQDAVGDGALVVSLTEPVANSKYPTLQAALSVVDATSGRPVAALHPASLVVTDDAGRLELVDLSPTVSDRTPVALLK